MVKNSRTGKISIYGKKKKPNQRTSKMDKWQNAKISKLISLSTPELKRIRGNIAVTSITSSGLIVDFANLISQGTGAGQRIGNKLKIMSINIRGWMNAGDDDNTVRLMFLRNISGSLGLADMPNTIEFPNTNNYVVYKDKLYTLNTQWNGTNAVYPKRVFSMNIVFPKGKKIDYGGTVIDKQMIFYMVSASGALPHPQIQYEYAVNFIDA